MSSRTMPTADSDIDSLMSIETKAQNAFDAAMTALQEKLERRRNLRPEDTRAEVLKLDAAIASAEVDVDIERGAYMRANAARVAAEEAIAKERRAKLRAELLATGARLVREAAACYDAPLRETVMPFVDRTASYFRACQDFDRGRGPDEEPIVNLFEEMRRTPGTPDQVVEVVVERRVRPERLGRDELARPGEDKDWPIEKVRERQTVPGQPRITPTPLHEAFKAPALRPGEQNYRVEGTRDGHSIDVNGADF
jgi:hypothetical protein